MTRALAAAYLACIPFAALPDPYGRAAVACGVLCGVLALASFLRRLTTKGHPHHA